MTTIVQDDLFDAVLADDGSHWQVRWRRLPARPPLRSLPGLWSRAKVQDFLLHYADGFEDGFRQGQEAGRAELQGQLRGLLGAAARGSE